MPADNIEDHIGLSDSDAFEDTTTGTVETGQRLFVDGGNGEEKEVNMLSHHAGASSDAPASSGIPSAMRQSGVTGEAFDRQDATPMANNALPRTQNTLSDNEK